MLKEKWNGCYAVTSHISPTQNSGDRYIYGAVHCTHCRHNFSSAGRVLQPHSASELLIFAEKSKKWPIHLAKLQPEAFSVFFNISLPKSSWPWPCKCEVSLLPSNLCSQDLKQNNPTLTWKPLLSAWHLKVAIETISKRPHSPGCHCLTVNSYATVKFVKSPALTQDSSFWPVTASANKTAQVTHKNTL